MPSPNQKRRASSSAQQIDNPQFLPYCQSLRHYREAPFGPNIHGIALGAKSLFAVNPFNCNAYARVYAKTSTHLFYPRRSVYFVDRLHTNLLFQLT